MTATPWPVRASRKYGQSAVLYAALALSAPGEYSLGIMAGWSSYVAWLMPAVMSLYAAISASGATAQKEAWRVAAGTPKEQEAQRRYKSATRGALAALFLATAAQVTDHILTADVVGPRVWVLVAVSSVPPLVAAHVLHIDPPADVESGQPREAPPQTPQPAVSGLPTASATVEPPKPSEAPQQHRVSYREAADALGMSEITIRGWANDGKVQKFAGPTAREVRVDLIECQNVKDGRRVAVGG